MASQIEIRNGVASFFSVRKVPWHKLGIVVENAPTSAEAIKLAHLDWDVVPEPVYLEGGVKIPNLMANVRSTDRFVLGTRSDSYTVVQNRDAFAFADGLLGDGAVYETAGALYGGQKIFLSAKLPKPINILGDEIQSYLLLTSSHDGFGSVIAADVKVRPECQNTINIGLKSARRTFRARHTRNVQDKLALAHSILEMSDRYGIALTQFAENAASQWISPAELDKFIDTLFGNAKEATGRSKTTITRKVEDFRFRLNYAPDLANFRKPGATNKWALVNAVTDFDQHSGAVKQTSTLSSRRIVDISEGSTLVDNALNLLALV